MKTFIPLILIPTFLPTLSYCQNDNCLLECLTLGKMKCEICYQKCSLSNSYKIKMKSCKFKECFYPTEKDCESNLVTYLSQEKCLEKCCHSNKAQFSQQVLKQCNNTNAQLRNKIVNDNEVNPFLIFLAVIGAPLVAFSITLLVIYLQKKSTSKKNQLLSQACYQPLVKKLPWKDIFMPQNCNIYKPQFYTDQPPNCVKCKKAFPNSEMKCGHIFHISCLRQMSQGKYAKCPSCGSFLSINKQVRIFCQKCKLREAKIHVDISQQTLQKMLNFMKINCDKCIENPDSAAGNNYLSGISEEQSKDTQDLIEDKL